jgi:hypothetical protein
MKMNLDPYEQWMVKSNLKTIESGVPAEEIIQTLRRNGYDQIADVVCDALKIPSKS